MTPDFHIPLTPRRQATAVELQAMLVDLLDLTLIGKHAHWNVEGRLFRSVHKELDELVDAWRRLSDDVAERAVAIGAHPTDRRRQSREPRSSRPFPAATSAIARC